MVKNLKSMLRGIFKYYSMLTSDLLYYSIIEGFIHTSYILNFRLTTQLLKLLEFCYADLNLQLFPKTKNPRNLFCVYIA